MHKDDKGETNTGNTKRHNM